jgi:hypothetical protein
VIIAVGDGTLAGIAASLIIAMIGCVVVKTIIIVSLTHKGNHE